MDDSDEWPDFRERLKEMGIEPNDEVIEILENMNGIIRPVSFEPRELADSRMDILLDKIESKLNFVNEFGHNINKKILSRNRNNRVKL